MIAVWSPAARRYEYFVMLAMPFGAAASVYGFNWVASGLKEVLVRGLRIGTTNFYDDFDVVEVERLAASARDAVQELFGLLGWALKSLPDFDVQSEPLGPVLDFSRDREGVAMLRNKPTPRAGYHIGHHGDGPDEPGGWWRAAQAEGSADV